MFADIIGILIPHPEDIAWDCLVLRHTIDSYYLVHCHSARDNNYRLVLANDGQNHRLTRALFEREIQT